jgi:hypothetical protein
MMGAGDSGTPVHVGQETTSRIQTLEQGRIEMEKTLARVDERLALGGAAINEIRGSLRDIATKHSTELKAITSTFQASLSETQKNIGASLARLSPQPISPWKVVVGGFAIFVTVATLIWNASRYPDRAELNAVRAEMAERRAELAARQDQTIGELRRRIEQLERKGSP